MMATQTLKRTQRYQYRQLHSSELPTILDTQLAAADVQWSAKVSMPLAGTNVYFAADEAGGDAYGVSGT